MLNSGWFGWANTANPFDTTLTHNLVTGSDTLAIGSRPCHSYRHHFCSSAIDEAKFNWGLIFRHKISHTPQCILFWYIMYVHFNIVVGSALVTVNCKTIVLLQLNSSYGKINWSESDVLNVNKYRHCAILSQFVNIMVYVIMQSCRKEFVVSSWQQNCTKSLLPRMWYFLMGSFVWIGNQ